MIGKWLRYAYRGSEFWALGIRGPRSVEFDAAHEETIVEELRWIESSDGFHHKDSFLKFKGHGIKKKSSLPTSSSNLNVIKFIESKQIDTRHMCKAKHRHTHLKKLDNPKDDIRPSGGVMLLFASGLPPFMLFWE